MLDLEDYSKERLDQLSGDFVSMMIDNGCGNNGVL